jgi:hypothetical protein
LLGHPGAQITPGCFQEQPFGSGHIRCRRGLMIVDIRRRHFVLDSGSGRRQDGLISFYG